MKIFLFLVETNKNYFICYFENEVLAAIEFFANKLCVLLTTLLAKNA